MNAKKKQSLYLGDIDPNNVYQNLGNDREILWSDPEVSKFVLARPGSAREMLWEDPKVSKISLYSPLEIRREFLYHLLVWDTIVVSDSQLLTDPRISYLMDHEDPRLRERDGMGLIRDWEPWQKVEPEQKGFELLLKEGLVEVAQRYAPPKEGDPPRTEADGPPLRKMTDIWTGMEEGVRKKKGNVPFLPKTVDHAAYLDGLGISPRPYDISKMGGLFRDNLRFGIEERKDLWVPSDQIMDWIREYCQEKNVLFSTILEDLRARLGRREIARGRFADVYDFVYGCYSVNTSIMVSDCSIVTRYRHLPLHLPSGDGDLIDESSDYDFKALRPSWALRKELLDLIPIKDFIKLHRNLMGQRVLERLQGYYLGIENDWSSFCSVWEDYTTCLEDLLELHLRARIGDLCLEIMKMNYTPMQTTVQGNMTEVVKSVLTRAASWKFPETKLVQVALEVLGILDDGKGALDLYHAMTKRNVRSLEKQIETIRRSLPPGRGPFTGNNTRVLTNYRLAEIYKDR